MKKLLLFIILHLVFLQTNIAQNYKPVITDSITKWSIVVLPNYLSSQEWVVTGDVVFNSIKYKKVSSFYSYSLFDKTLADSLWRVNPPENINNWYNRYVRQTDDNSKLYVYDEETKKEYLVYDMGLQKGDSFLLPLNSIEYLDNSKNSDYYSIVDSVYVKDNLKHIQLNSLSRYFQLKLTFIESIGPNLGMFYLYGAEFVNHSVFCLNCFQNKNTFYKQPIPLYQYPCAFDWNLNAVKTVLKEDYKLEQTDTKITLHFDTFANREINLYSITGNKIQSLNSSNSNNLTLDIDKLNKGCYVMQIVNIDEKKQSAEKIIIN